MSQPLLSAEQHAEFAGRGLLVLPGFYDWLIDIEPILEGIFNIIGEVMVRHGVADNRGPYAPDRFDVGYQSLIAMNRSWGGEVYDAVKQIPGFLRLVGHPKNERLFNELRPGARPGIAAGGYGIRIDNPHEERFRANWHQEYPAQLRSVDGIVFWSPLLEISPELGPVQTCPGSHRLGPLPVHTRDPRHPDKQGAYALTLKDEEQLLKQFPIEAPLTSPGDLIVMDFQLVHSSGLNTSTRSRWSMQFRYFNFSEPTGRAHGWRGSYACGVDFRMIHPELCAD